MGLGDVTRAGVQAAIEQSREVGREILGVRYGWDDHAAYDVVVDGQRYNAATVAAAAHLISTGVPLLEVGPDAGESTLAERLSALGLEVRAAEPPPTVQLVLQPRGGSRERGPQHFDKSVRRGVPLADVETALGSEAAHGIGALCPDGTVRLWGSTPTDMSGNAKARALEGRRAGDHVLFYAKESFLARAVILRLIKSSTLAKAVWGTDEEGATWEHVMVLGEVEEFAAPVPALGILRRLDVPAPLRSLTLRSAEAYGRVARLLPTRRPHGSDAAAGGTEEAPKPLSQRDLLKRLRTSDINRHTSKERAFVQSHDLGLLWGLARLVNGRPGMASWPTFRDEVAPLLAEFTPADSGIAPEQVFWDLRHSELWEIYGNEGQESPPALEGAVEEQPIAGLAPAVAELLQDAPTRLKGLELLLDGFLGGADRDPLLSRLGLSGYQTADGQSDDDWAQPIPTEGSNAQVPGPAPRRQRTSLTLQRDTRLVAKVKDFYANRCQICATRLTFRGKHYSEAAHIRGLGSPHHGPDELRNLLCLCPNHHVLFDGLAIFIDAEYKVRHVVDDKQIGELTRHPEHSINRQHLDYHRTLCRISRPSA